MMRKEGIETLVYSWREKSLIDTSYNEGVNDFISEICAFVSSFSIFLMDEVNLRGGMSTTIYFS